MKNILIAIVVILIIVLGGWFFMSHKERVPVKTVVTSSPTLINTVTYSCDASKTIGAAFYDGPTTPAKGEGQPPTPGGSVALTLSDGRTMTLVQTISADGGRYANADETFVFWSKGNGATVTESSKDTYVGCITVAGEKATLPQVYSSSIKGFSLRYPANYGVNEKYSYQALGPGKEISGVKFTIDPAISKGTNLSPDSYISVEQIPMTAASTCSVARFIDNGTKVGAIQTVTDGSTSYSVASTSDAAAGNRYEETVYAIPGTSPCIAIRYFIHYGVLENYPKGTVTQFDAAALKAQFDAIRRTLTLK
jgi:membrane-bound inhibitor of C-type lysozyme